MRKILSIGLFLSATATVAAHPLPASELARGYGVALLVLAMPIAVLGWGVWHEARLRARTEG